MDHFPNHQQLPVKMEPSPVESLLSAPGDNYTSLFTGQPSGASSPAINPVDVLTPASSAPFEAPSPNVDSPSQAAPDAKENKKKRKSWGQVLPQPKTNLPPRKRAKTEDEKEQRRVERVLRNRRAAQSSRERKRQEVELLEQRNRVLEDKLRAMEENNLRLEQELQRMQRSNGQAPSANFNSNSPLDRTLASNLFTTTNEEPAFKTTPDTDATINLAKLSPQPEDHQPPAEVEQVEPKAFQLPTARPSDVTQHSAAMLCDLQCPSEPASNRDPQAWAWMIYLVMMLRASVLSAWQRPLTQISLSLKTGSQLAPSPTILTTILWLVTRATASTTPSKCHSTSRSRRSTAILRSLGWRPSTAAQISGTSTPVTNLKVKLLRKILSCSPNLARPLLDATFAALRLVSNESHNQTVNTPVDVSKSPVIDGELTQLLKQMTLPSRTTLLTLAWTLQVEMKKADAQKQSSSIVLGPKSNAVPQHSTAGVTDSVALQDAAVKA